MNKLKKTFLIITIILLIFEIIGKAENDNSGFHGFPAYTISAFSTSPNVNQGDIFKINLFVSGAGDVDENKFVTTIPPYIVKNNIVKIEHIGYNLKDRKYVLPFKTEYMQSHFGSSFTYEVFKEKEHLANFGEQSITINETIYSPNTISFTVDDNAPPGDHIISMNLFYKNGTQWYSSEKKITIHIRYWHEQHLYLFAAIIALVGAIAVAISSFIFNKVTKKLNKPNELKHADKKKHK